MGNFRTIYNIWWFETW